MQRNLFAEVIQALQQAFTTIDVPWYIFGAQAALLYGSARLTFDVDATVLLGPRSTDELIDALKAQGIAPRITDAQFLTTTRVLPVVHLATGINADVVLGGPGLEELFAQRAELRDMGGVIVPVAKAEDLVAMKILAGRPRDTEDVAAMIQSLGSKFDANQTRETLQLLEQALDRSDLLVAFEEVFARNATNS